MNSIDLSVESKLILAQKLGFTDHKLKKVELFAKEVLAYNKKYNLISKNSEIDIWNRHIVDSAQLINFIDIRKHRTLSDLGTGGGFPGIILSIFFEDILTFHVKLYEKSKVKNMFLRNLIENMGIKNTSIYDNDYQSHNIDADYIVSRAFKKLPEMLRISREIVKKPHKLIVMLGKSAQDEVNKASKDMIYKYKLIPSITQSDSRILLVDASK